MKGKVIRGSGFRGVLNYVIDETKQARIIGGNLIGRDAAALSKEFGRVRRIRPDCRRPVLHIPLRMPAGEDVSDEKWLKIVISFMRLMQLSPNRPWVIVKHLDNHVHLITSRVDNRGKVWTGKWEALRCIKATQDIEKLFRLSITPGLRGRNPRQPRLTSGQLRKFQRELARGETPEVPAKVAVAERITRAIGESNGTFADFENRLTKLGVTVKRNTAKTTNHVSGIIFSFEGVTMKGSQVARAYGWQGITRLLDKRRQDHEHSGNSEPTPPAIAEPDGRRATQREPVGVGKRPDQLGKGLAKPTTLMPPHLLVGLGAGLDDRALDVLAGDESPALASAGESVAGATDADADPITEATTAPRRRRRKPADDGEADYEQTQEVTVT